MGAVVRIIRPHQWIKNLFVFIPLFFGGSILDGTGLWSAFVTFAAFCFTASSVYCFNDIVDADDDRHHPVKCRRPIASGAVSVARGYIMMAVMASLGFASLAALRHEVWHVAAVVAGYWLLNLAYCVRLKQCAIADVCIIAFGFVLRILAGGFATGIVLSKWIVLMTFLLTLFLSLAKRRDDVLRMNSTGEAPRRNTIRYNLTFINQAITITATVTIVCYVMYTVSPDVISEHDTDYLYLTSVFVILGLLRYLQLTVVDELSGDPTKVILRDHILQLIVVLWGLAFFFIIYL
ncbi:MAG: decaprenyl-phosphate phosphoribosyltransferase [Prevotella sp.]